MMLFSGEFQKNSDLILWIFTSFLLLMFLGVQIETRIPGDLAWLAMAAQHILSGELMTETFLDTNPPMSFLIYIPAALLMKAGFPLLEAVFFYTIFLLAISIFLTAMMLRAFPGMRGFRYWAILSAYMTAVIFISRLEFGNKDHLIAVTLVPFLLAQFCLSYSIPVSAWVVRTAFVLGTPFILLKPHFGLLPVLVLGHRLWRQRRLSIVLDFDFLCLAVGVVAYAVVIALRFPDFLSDVLWESLRLYVTEPFSLVYPASLGLAIFSLSMLVLCVAANAAKEEIRIGVFLSVMALASVIPFYVQLKGFSLHMLPTLGLLFPAAAITGSLYFSVKKEREFFYAIFFLLAMFSAGFYFGKDRYISHEDFKSSPMVRYIQDHAAGSSFLIQSTSTNNIVPAAVYTGIPHGTRFPALWFVAPLSKPQNADLIPRFSRLVAEDLERYKPAFVALYHDPYPGDDMLRLFQGQPEFDMAWSSYRYREKMEFDYTDFYGERPFRDTPYTVYDIYERK